MVNNIVKPYTYSDLTYNNSNLIQRFTHRSRLEISLDMVDMQPGDTCLDFGCGDGKFLLELSKYKNIDPDGLVGYDPYTDALDDLPIQFFTEFVRIEQYAQRIGGFSFITCFEVLEHFSLNGQIEQIGKIIKLLHPDGRLVISVPIEIFIPSLFKNAVSKIRRHLPGYSFRNILLSLIGRAPRQHRVDNEFLSHMGFDFRHLETLLLNYFSIERKAFSPFPRLPFVNLNSQVFFVLRRRQG